MKVQLAWKNPFLIAAIAVLLVSCESSEQAGAVQQEQQEQVNLVGPPTFEYDPSWPKPLPNNWALGEVWGVAVDSRDNPWILHGDSDRVQGMLAQEGKELAPPVVQFDPEGNVLQAWGGPGEGYDWMQRTFGSEHGMFIDHEDNVWVIGGGNGDFDGGVALKFTSTGEFLLQIGEKGKTNGSHDRRLLGAPTTAAVAPDTNEVYVADGYVNQRVVVFDGLTGEYKRHWGAYGRPPDDGPAEPLTPDGPAPQRWNATHCVRVAHDGLVYVCDRSHNRVPRLRNRRHLRRGSLLGSGHGRTLALRRRGQPLRGAHGAGQRHWIGLDGRHFPRPRPAVSLCRVGVELPEDLHPGAAHAAAGGRGRHPRGTPRDGRGLERQHLHGGRIRPVARAIPLQGVVLRMHHARASDCPNRIMNERREKGRELIGVFGGALEF